MNVLGNFSKIDLRNNLGKLTALNLGILLQFIRGKIIHWNTSYIIIRRILLCLNRARLIKGKE